MPSDKVLEEVIPGNSMESRQQAEALRNGLQRVLEKLRAEDPLFYHLLPEASSYLQPGYPPQAALDEIQRSYSRKEILIEDPVMIEHLVEAGDKVLKNGTFKIVTASIHSGDEGVVLSGSYPKNLISFSKMKAEIGSWDLLVVGRRGWFTDERYNPPYRLSGALEEHQIVRYTGEPIEKCTFAVPDGTEGIVIENLLKFSPNDNDNLKIAWRHGPKVSAYSFRDGKRKGQIYKTFAYHEVKLVRPVNTDLEAVLKECLGENYATYSHRKD